MAVNKLLQYIVKKNFAKNLERLEQGVIANLLFPEIEPNWDTVSAWQAQSALFGMSENKTYENGVNSGKLFVEALLNQREPTGAELLSSELLNY